MTARAVVASAELGLPLTLLMSFLLISAAAQPRVREASLHMAVVGKARAVLDRRMALEIRLEYRRTRAHVGARNTAVATDGPSASRKVRLFLLTPPSATFPRTHRSNLGSLWARANLFRSILGRQTLAVSTNSTLQVCSPRSKLSRTNSRTPRRTNQQWLVLSWQVPL